MVLVISNNSYGYFPVGWQFIVEINQQSLIQLRNLRNLVGQLTLSQP